MQERIRFLISGRVVELEFREFTVFFLKFVSPDFCKAPADREGVMDDKRRDDEVG